jgi:hypothetical protein
MADGHKILERAQKIKDALPGTAVILKTTAPICSKAKAFLEESGIQVFANTTSG